MSNVFEVGKTVCRRFKNSKRNKALLFVVRLVCIREVVRALFTFSLSGRITWPIFSPLSLKKVNLFIFKVTSDSSSVVIIVLTWLIYSAT